MSDRPTDGVERWEDSGIELDTLAHDNPWEALRIGLESDDQERVLGAYRLLQASGREAVLPFHLSVKLAQLFEQLEMYLDAARAYRKAIESGATHNEAPKLIFRCAWLLLGPANKPEHGAAMLRYLIANYPSHPMFSQAEKILEQVDGGDASGLAQSLEEAADLMGELYDTPVPDISFQPASPSETGSRISPQRVAGWLRLYRVLYIGFAVLLVVYVVTRFTRDRYRSVDDIHPLLLRQPLQTEIKRLKIIQVTYGDYRYTLTPRYRYSISALVVSKDDYTMLGLSRGNLFHLDLCMIWGGNVKNRSYKHSGLNFVHHGNVCYATSRGGVGFRFHELSNTHILAADDVLRDAFDDVGVGDQIRIQGSLVDVAVVPVKASGLSIPTVSRLKTSTSRVDAGMGACEILYTRDLEVLIEANIISRRLNQVSFVLLLILGLAFILRLILLPVGLRS